MAARSKDITLYNIVAPFSPEPCHSFRLHVRHTPSSGLPHVPLPSEPISVPSSRSHDTFSRRILVEVLSRESGTRTNSSKACKETNSNTDSWRRKSGFNLLQLWRCETISVSDDTRGRPDGVVSVLEEDVGLVSKAESSSGHAVVDWSWTFVKYFLVISYFSVRNQCFPFDPHFGSPLGRICCLKCHSASEIIF